MTGKREAVVDRQSQVLGTGAGSHSGVANCECMLVEVNWCAMEGYEFCFEAFVGSVRSESHEPY